MKGVDVFLLITTIILLLMFVALVRMRVPSSNHGKTSKQENDVRVTPRVYEIVYVKRSSQGIWEFSKSQAPAASSTLAFLDDVRSKAITHVIIAGRFYSIELHDETKTMVRFKLVDLCGDPNAPVPFGECASQPLRSDEPFTLVHVLGYAFT